LQRRTQDRTLPADAALRETILNWYDPVTLDLLHETPINCLLVTWSAGGRPEMERRQQKAVRAYAREARARGIAVLGLVHAGAAPSSFVGPALEGGLDGFVLEGDFPDREGLAAEIRRELRDRNSTAVVFSFAPREELIYSPETPVLAAGDAVAPGLRELTKGIDATPSSEPWIDSNIWLVRSISSRGGPRPIWLGEQMAGNAAPTDYLRAVADAAAAGGLWVVALSDELRHDLRRKQPEARETWHRIAAFLKFRQQHADWYRCAPFAVYGFVQDSSGRDRIASGENLKLACRQRVPLRVIERAQLGASALDGLRAVHAIDLIRPTEHERQVLSAFTESGGLTVAGPSWQQVEIPPNQDFAVIPNGRGRVVVFRDEWPEPGSLARDLADLLGRDNLGVRLFRAASVLSHVSRDTAGGPLLVQLLNYATYPADSVLVRVVGDFHTARFYAPDRSPQELALERSNGRLDITLPGLPVYGVVLLEK
jgi:hypothetical protein